MGIRYLHIILFLLVFESAKAQDIHYSQFYTSPMLLNPALTGFSKCRIRAGLNYKSQWGSFTTPYITQSAYLDMRLKLPKNPNDWIGTALSVYKDEAGDGNLSTTKPMIQGSYYKGLSSNNQWFSAIGFGVGYANRTINMDALTFESQWTGNEFDRQRNNLETLKSASIYYIDLNAGFLLAYFPFYKSEYWIGFSLSHLNRPNNSFFEDEHRMNRKWMLHGGIKGRISKHTYFHTEIAYFQQAKASEILCGATIKHRFKDMYFVYGTWTRLMRDIIPLVGVEYHSYTAMMCYDINVSSLTTSSNYKGGLEISFQKTIKCSTQRTKYNYKDHGSIPCAPF